MQGNIFYFYKGRVALYAILKTLNVGPGDEVILQAYTCFLVVAPIVGIGARLVFVEIDPKTFKIDSSQLESKVSNRTKVIIVQHT